MGTSSTPALAGEARPASRRVNIVNTSSARSADVVRFDVLDGRPSGTDGIPEFRPRRSGLAQHGAIVHGQDPQYEGQALNDQMIVATVWSRVVIVPRSVSSRVR